MELETIRLSEISQSYEDNYCMLSLNLGGGEGEKEEIKDY
jgi:hypothetical protein